jgi:predicted enzyme related to lactoylglutathione lyase
VDAVAAARAWVAAWERAWPAGDAAPLAAVYAGHATMLSHPFREPQTPLEYASWAFGEQASATCRFGVPVVEGDRAAVDWWAVVVDAGGAEETLAGTSLLRFGPDGQVVEQRDVWAAEPGRRELPAWAPPDEDRATGVRELRLAVTAEDYDTALSFYRDVLGLREREAYTSEDGRVTILDAGRATLELLDPMHAAFVDEVEVGRRVAGHVRIAFEVDDARAATDALEAAGATVVAPPTRTPWDSLNARLDAPGGLQLTLFTELGR